MAPVDRPHTTYCQSATVTMSPSCIISEIKRDIGRKSRFFHTPAFDAPFRESPLERCHTVWYEKTRMMWLHDSWKKSDDMFSHFDTIPVCDRQTS